MWIHFSELVCGAHVVNDLQSAWLSNAIAMLLCSPFFFFFFSFFPKTEQFNWKLEFLFDTHRIRIWDLDCLEKGISIGKQFNDDMNTFDTYLVLMIASIPNPPPSSSSSVCLIFKLNNDKRTHKKIAYFQQSFDNSFFLVFVVCFFWIGVPVYVGQKSKYDISNGMRGLHMASQVKL